MNLPETDAFLVWLNQIDPRLEPNDVSSQVWNRALERYPPEICREAALDWCSKNTSAPRPAPIRELASRLWERRLREESRRIESNDPTKITFAQWKARYPGRALECYEKGRRMVLGDAYVPLAFTPEWCVSSESALTHLGQMPFKDS